MAGCAEMNLICGVTAPETLSADQFGYFARQEQDLPAGARYELKRHACTCSCDAQAVRHSVHVTLDEGPLTFTREYALAPELDALPAN